MSGIVKSANPGLGFDVNQSLSITQARAFFITGYIFCIRYLPRTPYLKQGNLTAQEIAIILNTGLSLSVVQHCPLPGWEPSIDLGSQYGQYAGAYATEIGLPIGMNIWLDLEEVATNSTSQNVIDYCKAWFVAVQAAGYIPGIYCGYGTNLSSQQLYDLPFKHYWKAYNYDNGVAIRGFQIIQEPQKTMIGIQFDPNKSQIDNKGDVAIWLSPN